MVTLIDCLAIRTKQPRAEVYETTRQTWNKLNLVHLLNLGPSTSSTRRSTTELSTTHVSISTRRTTCTSLVHLRNDRVADTLELLHLILKLVHLSQLVVVQPVNGLLD